MKLKKLFKDITDIEIKGLKDIEISGVCNDSRYVYPNSLFIAKKGESFDAASFIQDAISAGAIAIVTDMYDPFINVTQIIHENPNEIEADIAANYYQNPSKELFTIAITGTNGKTTTSYIVKHILDNFDKKSGLIGTIEYITGESQIFSKLTTPDNVSNQKYLREMVSNNLKSAVMETSSHGIEQNRIRNIEFDAAIFTNLTNDHLDYHQTMENYFLAKKKLFQNHLKENALSVINLDDEFGRRLNDEISDHKITYGLDNKADIYADNIKYSANGSEFDVFYKEKQERFFIPLFGKCNIYNTLAALSIGIQLALPFNKMRDVLKSLPKVKGRLEKVAVKNHFHLFVDHAHTPDALFNSLNSLKVVAGKIIVVFGCGGNRDKTKRPKMAEIAEKHADKVIVTTDNPRNENPQDIIDEILLGFSKKCDYIVEIDRKKAIETAIRMAKDEDIILIAGKGHENYQIIGNNRYPFDDVEIAKNLCKML